MTATSFGILILLGCSVAFSQADNTRKNKQDPNHTEMTADRQGQSEQDLELTRKIRQSVIADKELSINAKNIKIISNDGRVVLRGPVNSEKERSTIQRFADDAAGAAKVTNRLEVIGNSKDKK